MGAVKGGDVKTRVVGEGKLVFIKCCEKEDAVLSTR